MSRNIFMERFRTVGIDLSGPYTPDRLREIAAQAQAVYESLLADFPPGTIHDVRNNAYQLKEEAAQCAQWMQLKALESLWHVGSLDGRLLHKGMRVRVRPGALLKSMHPKHRGTPQRIERARVVTVNDTYTGFVEQLGMRAFVGKQDERALLESVRQPEVVWAGSGGYWCTVDANEIEIIH